jgi:hypothetical protein
MLATAVELDSLRAEVRRLRREAGQSPAPSRAITTRDG